VLCENFELLAGKSAGSRQAIKATALISIARLDRIVPYRCAGELALLRAHMSRTALAQNTCRFGKAAQCSSYRAADQAEESA
jgi:hypothetical protein